MWESRKRALQSYFDQMLKIIDFNVTAEEEFIQVAQSFDVARGQWQKADQELKEKREFLIKCESERSALQVMLKHARNQVEVEMRKRQKVEVELDKVEHLNVFRYFFFFFFLIFPFKERQLLLIGDLLKTDGQAVAPLSESVLAFFGRTKGNAATQDGNRTSIVDDSFLSYSGISYDRTDDDLDLDELPGKPYKQKPQERRMSGLSQVDIPFGTRSRSSLAPVIAPLLKRSRHSVATAIVPDNERETVIAKSTMLVTDGGSVQAMSTVEAVPRRKSRRSRAIFCLQDQSITLPQITEAEQEPELEAVMIAPSNVAQTHAFLSKTMIRAELCAVCGQKTRFGKMSLKCRNCRILIHPECKGYCSRSCSSPAPPTQSIYPKNGQGVLADFAPTTSLRVPGLVIHCVNEIERRGLSERGIYRISGCDSHVKELKQKLLQGKVKAQQLEREDIHAVCGALKEFLRNLQEPLLTFSLHAQFMDAADLMDENEARAEVCQAVHELPIANRETLSFLIVHLNRVMKSPDCKMDKMNLSRVFGPTLVGYSVPNPSPLMIMQDTPRQAKVMMLLLSVPCSFWNQFISSFQEAQNCDSVTMAQGRLFRPLTSPEMKIAPCSSNFPPPSSGNLPRKPGRLFTSPNA
ncbi:rac GTPase-activating 1-like [Pelobates cultripes]|uniref:Rac GTPase-activating 1-like n=1 Tax=Pelobates cultripes TaxID=61616 RepID=A0AAD1SPR7_PELCU|nr:rac GTPase-activating 1-like [Pelobates cultripes]